MAGDVRGLVDELDRSLFVLRDLVPNRLVFEIFDSTEASSSERRENASGVAYGDGELDVVADRVILGSADIVSMLSGGGTDRKQAVRGDDSRVLRHRRFLFLRLPSCLAREQIIVQTIS